MTANTVSHVVEMHRASLLAAASRRGWAGLHLWTGRGAGAGDRQGSSYLELPQDICTEVTSQATTYSQSHRDELFRSYVCHLG